MSTGKHIDKEFFVQKHTVDEQNRGIWLLLTDHDGQIAGLYKGKDAQEGFARVKGEVKKDGDNTYILVSEIIPTK